MRYLRFGKIVTIVSMLFLLGACSGRAETGAKAPDISLNDINFNTVTLSDFKGRVIILNFFATWCPPCKAEIPDFIDLQKEFGERKVIFIGISAERAGQLKEFVERFGINYPVLEDPAKKSYTAYGPIRGVPTTFIIGKDFKIRKIYIGSRPREVWETDIKELLAQ